MHPAPKANRASRPKLQRALLQMIHHDPRLLLAQRPPLEVPHLKRYRQESLVGGPDLRN